MPFSVGGPRLISSPVVLTVFQRMGREGGGMVMGVRVILSVRRWKDWCMHIYR